MRGGGVPQSGSFQPANVHALKASQCVFTIKSPLTFERAVFVGRIRRLRRPHYLPDALERR